MIENDIMETLKQLHGLVVSFAQSCCRIFVQNEVRKIGHVARVNTHRWVDFLRAIGGDIRVL